MLIDEDDNAFPFMLVSCGEDKELSGISIVNFNVRIKSTFHI